MRKAALSGAAFRHSPMPQTRAQSAKPFWLQFTLVAMWVALILLVWLQWRWSNELSAAYQDKLKSSIAEGSHTLAQTFRRDLDQLCRAVEERPSDNPGTLPHALYVTDATFSELRQYDTATAGWKTIPWPAPWSELREEMRASAEDLYLATSRRWFNRPWLASSSAPIVFRAFASAQDTDFSYRRPAARDIAGFLVIALDVAALQSRYLPANFGLTQVSASLRLGGGGGQIDLLSPELGPARIRPAGEASAWHLETTHKPGELDAAVAALRLRNLVTGGAVCLVLLAGTILLSKTASRARELARMQADFVAGFSHELRTPVTAIQTLASNLEDGLIESPPQVARYGALIHEQSQRLRARIEDILSFAAGRPHQARITDLDLRPLITAALREEANLLAGFEIETSIDAEVPLVQADAILLKSCLTNLLANAAKYAKQGAWLKVTATAPGNGWVSITVADRGPGIPINEQARLFEPFFRGGAARASQAPGSGLGLHLVRTRVEAMNGKVLLHSSPGNGSTFELLLRTGAA